MQTINAKTFICWLNPFGNKRRKAKIKFIILNDIKEETPLDNYAELSNYTDIPIFRLGYNEEIDSTLIKYLT